MKGVGNVNTFWVSWWINKSGIGPCRYKRKQPEKEFEGKGHVVFQKRRKKVGYFNSFL